MKLHLITLTAFTWLASSTGNAQFHQVVGGTGASEHARDMIQTADGGFLFVGLAGGYNSGDILAVKTDAAGTISWQKYYGFAGSIENASSVAQLSDGTYIIGGTSVSGANQYAYAVKISSTGTVSWSRTWNSTSAIHDVYADGTAIVLTGSYGTNAMVAKMTSSTGLITWHLSYNFGAEDVGMSVIKTSDGYYTIGGYSDVSGYKVLIFKVNTSLGTLQWANTYGCTDNQFGEEIIETSGGNLVIIGVAASSTGSQKQYIIKTNSSGTYTWSKLYGLDGLNHDGTDIIVTSDGGLMSCDKQGVLIKMNSSGVNTWTKRYHGGLSEIVQIAAGDYVFCGESTTMVGPLYDMYMVKTDVNGDCCADVANIIKSYTHTTTTSSASASTATPTMNSVSTSSGNTTFSTSSVCTLCTADAGPNKNNYNTDTCCTPVITCSPVGIGTSALPGYSYSWAPTTTVSPSSGSSTPTATPCSTTTYMMFASASGCLTNTDLVTVTTIHTACCPHMPLYDGGVTAGFQNITIYPNPTNGSFTVNIGEVTDLEQLVEITVTDITGRQVHYQKGSGGTSLYTVDINGESAGIYLVNVLVGDVITTTKIELE